MADIWLPINGDERVEQVRAMMPIPGRPGSISGAGDGHRDEGTGLGLSLEGGDVGRVNVGRIVAELGLPLIGPELPDYPEMTARAAAKWLRDA